MFCQDLLTIEHSDLHLLHYANELLDPSDLPFKNFIYSWHLSSFGSCYCKKKKKIYVCSLTEDKLRQIFENRWGTTLSMLWRNLSLMGGQKKQNWLQFVNFIEKVYQTLRTMWKDRKKTNKQKIQYLTVLVVFSFYQILTTVVTCSYTCSLCCS